LGSPPQKDVIVDTETSPVKSTDSFKKENKDVLPTTQPAIVNKPKSNVNKLATVRLQGFGMDFSDDSDDNDKKPTVVRRNSLSIKEQSVGNKFTKTVDNTKLGNDTIDDDDFDFY